MISAILIIVFLAILAAIVLPVYSRAPKEASSASRAAYERTQRLLVQKEAEAGEYALTAQASFAAAEAAVERQIIYTANLTLKVEDAAAAQEKVTALAKQAGGFVSGVTSTVSEVGQNEVNITIRVPAKEFDSALDSLRSLGKKISEQISTEEVTEEFVDLMARLRNLRREEERLAALMRRSGKLSDILAVEKELARVQGSMEEAQGRLRYLQDRVALSTITIRLTERGEAAVAPAGPFDVRFYLLSAVRSLLILLKGVAIVLIFVIIVGAPFWVIGLVYWKLRHRKQKA